MDSESRSILTDKQEMVFSLLNGIQQSQQTNRRMPGNMLNLIYKVLIYLRKFEEHKFNLFNNYASA